MKLEFSGQIFEKYSNAKFHKNPSSGSRILPCGRTDRHDEPESRISRFCERAQKAENVIKRRQIHKNGTKAVGKRK